MEFQRKRHCGSDGPLKGRVSKLGKLEDVSDNGSDDCPPRKFLNYAFDSDCYVWYCSGKSLSIFDI